MTDLRKAALSNTNLKRMGSDSGSNQGTSTPVERATSIEKTDSVVNLTKSSLYGIYRDDSYLNLSRGLDSDDSGIELVPTTTKTYIDEQPPILHRTATSDAVSTVKSPQFPLVAKLSILAGSAFIYNEITKHINYNHLSNNGLDLTNVPVSLTNAIIFSIFEKLKVGSYIQLDSEHAQIADNIFALTIQGIVMALAHPLMDRLLPKQLSVRLLSSNPTPDQARSYSNLLNDLIRASITFLGISYATRKIEWNSFLQVSIIWSLLNPGLWLLLDGTISGLLASLVVSVVACSSVYFENYSFLNHYAAIQHDDSIALCLWIASFFFCGIIIFGKIGRGLFGK